MNVLVRYVLQNVGEFPVRDEAQLAKGHTTHSPTSSTLIRGAPFQFG